MEEDNEELITPREVAVLFGTSTVTVKKLPITQYRLSERVIRFKKSDVLNYMAQRKYAKALMADQPVG